jgi:hypothetical protein
MKKKILFSIALILFFGVSFSQTIPFGFIRNSTGFARSTMTDELNKKHFSIVDRKVEGGVNPVMEGATYYSNMKDQDPAQGEIRVLSQIKGAKNVVEVSWINGSKNDYSKTYTEVYNAMVNFFKDERSYKNPKYGVVNTFSRDKVYYYVFKLNNIPMIVASNYKLDEEYFGGLK